MSFIFLARLCFRIFPAFHFNGIGGSFFKKNRVKIASLAVQHVEIIKGFRNLLQVPLANHGCLIPQLFHFVGQVLLFGTQPSVQVLNPIGLAVLACHNTCPRRRTN